jgi:hypothetical protein
MNVAAVRFRGGVRTRGGFNATSPFASLTLTDDELLIRLFGFRLLRSTLGEVESVERTWGGVLGQKSHGLLIRLKNGSRIVFWTWQLEAVVAALKAHDVVVLEAEPPPKVWWGA